MDLDHWAICLSRDCRSQFFLAFDGHALVPAGPKSSAGTGFASQMIVDGAPRGTSGGFPPEPQSEAAGLDLARFTDTYTQRLAEFIDARDHGKTLVAAPQEEEPQIVKVMDALKQSMRRAESPKRARVKPLLRKATSAVSREAPARAASGRKRKSG